MLRRYRSKEWGQKKSKENRFRYGSAYFDQTIHEAEEA
jgi:hypothetical protein